MDDERPKPSLADDPSFLDSLGELDSGLSHDAMDLAQVPAWSKGHLPARPAPRTAAPAAPLSLDLRMPVDVDAATDAPAQFAARGHAAAGAQPRRRTFAAFPSAALAPLPPPLAPAAPIAAGAPGAPEGASRRRPLIDLFPPSATIPDPFERVRGPEAGNAPGPSLRPRPAPVFAPDPALTYEPFYGLVEKPFGLSTDLKFLYHSASYDRVIQELSDAIVRGDRVMMLTGEIGAGKTTLCRALSGRLDRRTLTSVVVEPLASVDDLLKTVLVDFGVMSREDLSRGALARATLQDLRAALAEFLASLASLQASAVVIIDEAQNMSADIFEQVRAWSDGESGQKRLQVVLAGQPALTSLLRRREHGALDRRIALRSVLGPLAQDEVVGYVMHRLSVAGASVRVEFNDAAIARIHDTSRGVPGIVNLLCDRALTRGFQASASVIDAALIDDAAGDLDLAAPRSSAAKLARAAVTVAVLTALMLVGAGGAALLFRDRVQQVLTTWRTPAPSR